MKKLILVTGDLATGKTTFTKIIAEKYSINVFHKDSIKEILGDTIGFKNREENLKLSGATMHIMSFLFLEFAKQGKDLILEANFRKENLDSLHKIAKEYGYDVLTLSFEGKMETIYERYNHRVKFENRHPVHLSTPFETIEEFAEYINKFRNITLDGEVLKINADDFSYQSDEKVLNYIDRFLNKK